MRENEAKGDGIRSGFTFRHFGTGEGLFAPGEALEMTRAYGTKTGIRLRNIFRKVTSLPGIPTLMWRNMDKIEAKMSSGYECRDVVVTEHLCSLDVTGCPLYDKASEEDLSASSLEDPKR